MEKKLYRQALEKWGGEAQVKMMVEEMSELTKALMKFSRYKTDEELIMGYEHIIEEIADVQIMLDQMKIQFGGNGLRLKTITQEKLTRLENLLKD